MTFDSGEIYRHDNSRDVDVLVVETTEDTPNWFKLKVFWVSRNSGFLLSADEVTILKGDVPKWKRVSK